MLRAENNDRPKLAYTKFRGDLNRHESALKLRFDSNFGSLNCLLIVSDSSLYALQNAGEYLLAAPLNELVGWKWSDLSRANEKVLILLL